jgi:hypothetical protein
MGRSSPCRRKGRPCGEKGGGACRPACGNSFARSCVLRLARRHDRSHRRRDRLRAGCAGLLREKAPAVRRRGPKSRCGVEVLSPSSVTSISPATSRVTSISPPSSRTIFACRASRIISSSIRKSRASFTMHALSTTPSSHASSTTGRSGSIRPGWSSQCRISTRARHRPSASPRVLLLVR